MTVLVCWYVCVCLMFFCFTNFVGGLLTFMHMNSVFSLSFEDIHIVYLSYCRGFIYLYAVQVATRFSAVFSDSTIWKQCKYIYKIKNDLIQKYKKVSCWKETDTQVLPHLVFWFTVTLQCCWSVFFSWNFFPVFFQRFYLHILYILFPFFPISSDFCSAHAGLLFTYFFLGENTTISISALFNNWRRKKNRRKNIKRVRSFNETLKTPKQ